MSTLLGTTLSGRYRLEKRIGAGGMSTVYLALDETLQRHVAIKMLNREVASDSDQLERFRREARAVAQLSHPHVVGVIDAGEDEQRPYIVFEYVEGETLKDRIRRLGRLPIPEAVAYAIEIARALGTAHARHIVHRDVKPQNVMIDDEGTAKVTDFGIARTLEEDGLTADGRVLGTTDYVSPEQALGHHVTGQSDLYSLGVVLYEMLTGEVPFKGENQVAVAMKHVREEMPDVSTKRPEVSAALASIVDTATSKQPEDRYADDQELIADLEDVLAIETARAGGASGEVTSVLRTLPARARRRLPFLIMHRGLVVPLAAALLAVVIGVGIWLVLRSHRGGVTSGGGSHHPSAHKHGQPVSLCSSCVAAYNPFGKGGVGQNNNTAALAIDGDPTTGWQTEHYYSGLGKPGVGLYVQAAPGTTATRLHLDTNTPGFAVKVYGTNTVPNPTSFATSNWGKPLGSVSSVSSSQSIPLHRPDARYSYYLVWITRLPANQQSASINELTLYN
ncbi:MAG: serine/threonine protein kinase [Solirubrobacterales bacterium]|nr:serine/threonine protein kinase [Solirubrobacterales bacterium]